MYATALYEPYMDAIVISMDEALSDNVPAEINVPAWFQEKREIINYRKDFRKK